MHYSVCDYLTDIVQNAVEAKASLIFVDFKETSDVIEIVVADNGPGMNKDKLQKVIDPFYTSKLGERKRRVGLGLPFLKQAVQSTGGNFEIKSDQTIGTSVYFSFDKNNIDHPPLGNLAVCFLTLFGLEPNNYELTINRSYREINYTLSKKELEEILGDLHSADALLSLKKQLLSFEKELKKYT
jgi:hypothetical protein